MPGTGWLTAETLADASHDPFGPKVAVGDTGEAVVAWGQRDDGLVVGRRFTKAGGWDAGLTMTARGLGTPQVLPPFIASDGRMLVTWDSGDAIIGMRVFRPSTG